MSFADIVAGLNIASFRKKYALDNIAWILNCVPLKQEQEEHLKTELSSLSANKGVTYQVVDGFVMLNA